MMNKPKFKRDQDFNPDLAISTGSGHYHDYKNSGYRRGHLVPAGDMSWNKQAMDATFLLSNVAPMTAKFNDGIWSELEKDVRDWARAYQKIYVVAGPVFRNPITTIGENEITVPGYFYKAVFALKDGEPKVIGFLFDQKRQSYGPLSDYIVPIDSIEKETGIDLFANLYGSWDAEIAYEKQRGISTGDWLFNERWYAERLNEEMKNTK
jgi:endonuclease G